MADDTRGPVGKATAERSSSFLTDEGALRAGVGGAYAPLRLGGAV